MEGRLLARARARQAEIRSQNKAAELRRREEISALCPEVDEIGIKLRSHMHELVGLALGQPGRSAEELEAESLALQERRRVLLRKAGYPDDYLDPIFSCPICRDTGWVGERMCDCLVRLYKQEQTEETQYPFKLFYHRSAGKDEDAAQYQGSKDTPEEHFMLVFPLNAKEREQHQEYKEIIHRQ